MNSLEFENLKIPSSKTQQIALFKKNSRRSMPPNPINKYLTTIYHYFFYKN